VVPKLGAFFTTLFLELTFKQLARLGLDFPNDAKTPAGSVFTLAQGQMFISEEER